MLQLLKNKKFTILKILLIVNIIVFCYQLFHKNVYEAKIFLSLKNFEGRDLDINKEIQFIRSLPVVNRIITKTHVMPVDERNTQDFVYDSSISLQSNVNVEKIASNKVAISVISDNPKKAALMAAAFGDVFVEQKMDDINQYTVDKLDRLQHKFSKKIDDIILNEQTLYMFPFNKKVLVLNKEDKETLDTILLLASMKIETEINKVIRDINKYKNVLLSHNTHQLFESLIKEVSKDNFLYFNLERRILELEFEQKVSAILSSRNVESQEKTKKINKYKTLIIDQLKEQLKNKLTMELELDFSLAIRKLFLENRKRMLLSIMNHYYIDDVTASLNDNSYIKIKKETNKLVDTYLKELEEYKFESSQISTMMSNMFTIEKPNITPVNNRWEKLVLHLISSIAAIAFIFVFFKLKNVIKLKK